MGEEKTIDQTRLAEDLSSKIHFNTKRQFLVKPLDPIKVTKEFDKPVATNNTPKVDENGIEAIDYDKVETEVKEVESDFRKGVVLKVPFEYQQSLNSKEEWKEMPISVGDVVIYPSRAGQWFDQLKDTQLVSPYEIVAVEVHGI